MRKGFQSALLTITLMPLSIDAWSADGQLDAGFGVDGIAVLEPIDNGLEPSSLVVQDDGSILVCRPLSYSNTGSDGGFVHRLLRDGLADPGFAEGGRARLDAIRPDWPCAIALQHDERIVVLTGSVIEIDATSRVNATRLFRLENDGSLDMTFGNGDHAPYVDIVVEEGATANAVAIQDDDSIVVGIPLRSNRFMVARFDNDGAVDSTFGDNGRVTIQFPWDVLGVATISDVLVDSRQRIVVAGSISTSPVGRNLFAAARLLSDGSIDTGFAGAGWTTVDLAARSSVERTAFLQDGDRIVLAGAAQTVWPPNQGSGNSDVGIARLLDDGTLDLAFGTDGMNTIPIDLVENAYDIAFAGLARTDGTIVLVGNASAGDGQRKGLLLEVDGNRRPGPGVAPYTTWIFDDAPLDEDASFYAIARQGNDYIVVGYAWNPPERAVQFVARISGPASPEHSRRPLPAELVRSRIRN